MTQDEIKKYINSHFVEIKLDDMIKHIGENDTKSILSNFSCPKNKDVEHFLKFNAIQFSKQQACKTNLVYWVADGYPTKELIGYYTVAQKYISIPTDAASSRERSRLKFLGTWNDKKKTYDISAPLIAQLGKNFTNGNDTLISGDDLLHLAMDKVRLIQNEIGGKFAYVECEDTNKLIEFYIRNGFKVFGKRNLDGDETDLKGAYLVQLFTML